MPLINVTERGDSCAYGERNSKSHLAVYQSRYRQPREEQDKYGDEECRKIFLH